MRPVRHWEEMPIPTEEMEILGNDKNSTSNDADFFGSTWKVKYC